MLKRLLNDIDFLEGCALVVRVGMIVAGVLGMP